ncbi:MAG: transposase [Pseudomonadota bacterium]
MMTAYRRLRRPGGTYFFTVNLADRDSHALVTHWPALKDALVTTRRTHAFRTVSLVVLPDHLHAIWTLPDGDADFSTRWRLIKSRFSRETGSRGARTPSHLSKSERGVWQRRFWEHWIRDDRDLARCLRYCWLNPVKHGLVDRPVDWPLSTIHRDISAGRVPPDMSGETDPDFGERAARVMGGNHPSYEAQ